MQKEALHSEAAQERLEVPERHFPTFPGGGHGSPLTPYIRTAFVFYSGIKPQSNAWSALKETASSGWVIIVPETTPLRDVIATVLS